MNNFEATILISPDITKDDHSKIVDMIEKLVVNEGGKVIDKEDWGLRDLAYKINTLKKAFYYFYQISIDSQKIKTLKNNFSLNERIIRYLFIKVNEHDKLPTKILKGNE